MTHDERIESLQALEAEVWRGLAQAVVEREHPWRLAVLATVADGLPDARSVVLRDCDPEARRLAFYSDARAGKIAQMREQPIGTLVQWWAERGWQLRLRARLEVETDGLGVIAAWARLKFTPGAQDYLSPLAPGSAIEEAPARPYADRDPHFAIVSAWVESVDWLELHPLGRRRARFASGERRWLQP